MSGPTLNPSDDFPLIFDGVETVSLVRKEDDTDITAVAGALRRAESSTDRPVGAVPDCDARWHLPDESLDTDPPRPGDLIVDSDGRRWTIYTVDTSRQTGRYTCHARDLAGAYRFDRRLTVQRASYTKSETGVTDAAWSQVAVFDGRIRTVEMKPEGSDRRTAGRVFEIVLAESISLSADHRIRDELGTVYRIERVTRVDDPAALPTILVTLWDDA